ncbi:HERC2, partial [Symbiodinium pilosum]
SPHIHRGSLDAVLSYLMSGRFFSGGDATFAFGVRKLADQFCLKDLVDKVEAELVTMLSKQRVLAFLGQVFGSGGRLEAACLEMVKANDCAVLRRQKEKLGQ